ncbi:MAG: DUF1015 domain-containing protein [Dehalococcoidia bacterium]|nr:DUF1015 domain-containing protein [Dehalococcoidia bacterium]
MPQMLPFRGLRYTAAAGPLAGLLAPPYDVISPAQQQSLEARNAHNAVHLELAGGNGDRYERVAALIARWQAEGLLAREAVETLYVYEQGFVERGWPYRRRALIAEVEAQPWEEGAVRPHEYTMSGPKEDRLRLLEATRVQLSPVFMIARDRAGQLQQFLEEVTSGRAPDLEAQADGEEHRLWLVEAGRLEMRRLAPLLSETFYIADGHHRYETAVAYRRLLQERGEELPRDHPARFAMTAIVAASDPGLVVRPIHRIVPRRAPADWHRRLDEHFTIEEVKLIGNPEMQAPALETVLEERPGGIVAVNLALDGQAAVLCPRSDAVYGAIAPAGHSEAWTRVAANLLRYGVLGPLWGIGDDELRAGAVEYTHEATEVLERTWDNPQACGFLLSPVGLAEVMALADAGERMPQKSTFFHPKLGTGLVFHPLDP